MKKPFHKFIIPPDDPVFKYDYNYLFMRDKESRKKVINEIKVCKNYAKKRKLNIDEKTLKGMKVKFKRQTTVPNYIIKQEGGKKHTRKSNFSFDVFSFDDTFCSYRI